MSQIDNSDDGILATARAGFLDETREMLHPLEEALLALDDDPDDTEILNSAFRAAHTIKGTAGLFGCDRVAAFTHDVETLMEAVRSGPYQLDDEAMGLLQSSRDQIEALLGEVASALGDPALSATSTDLGTQLRALLGKDAAAGVAAQALPAAGTAPHQDGQWRIWSRFGMDALRNSLDHGLETSEERPAAGKPERGVIALHAYHEGGQVLIEVTDDGRGLVKADHVFTEHEIDQLITAPGCSTVDQVTDILGRGVGMDVVKRSIESLRGQMQLASEWGRGTTTQIRLPLTLAIIDGFLTSVGTAYDVLPMEIVSECIEVPPECQNNPDVGVGHFDLRGEVLPYFDIALLHKVKPIPNGRRSLVVARDGHTHIGLVVDRLHGEYQTVIKPLSALFKHLRAIAGSTILGSCIAVTLWHPRRSYWGMCHFLLPTRPRTPDGSLDGRFGDEALELLSHEIKKTGTKSHDYEVHLYGGADTMPDQAHVKFNIGERNVEKAWELIDKYGFQLQCVDVGGNEPRNVTIDLTNGAVVLKRGNPHTLKTA